MKTNDVSKREQELFKKIKGMDYQDALDKYLEESIAIELEKHDVLPEYSSFAVTNNLFILRNAKKRIYENRGQEVKNSETLNGAMVLFFILTVYFWFAYSANYDYSPIKVFVFSGLFLFSLLLNKIYKKK